MLVPPDLEEYAAENEISYAFAATIVCVEWYFPNVNEQHKIVFYILACYLAP